MMVWSGGKNAELIMPSAYNSMGRNKISAKLAAILKSEGKRYQIPINAIVVARCAELATIVLACPIAAQQRPTPIDGTSGTSASHLRLPRSRCNQDSLK